MITKQTTTTGTVKGQQEVKEFLRTANLKFNEVRKTDNAINNIPADYLQYTLLTGNRIEVILSNQPLN